MNPEVPPPAKTRPSWVTWLLVLLPVWLLASAGGALWYYFHREKVEAAVEQQRFVRNVSVPMLADDLRKLVEVIGERNGASESAATGLARTAAMIEGLLGPSNTGYRVEKTPGPADFPILRITIRGSDPDAAPVWVVTSYDSRPGSRGAEANASGLAATLAAAQALAADSPKAPIHFAFLPHANDPEAPVLETVAQLAEMAADSAPAALLCVEAMGAGEELWLTSRDLEASPLERAKGLGRIVGAEVICLGDDGDLASLLFEMDLPAVRVATRPQVPASEPDDRPPFAPTVAAATGRLVELIRRCAAAR